MLRPWNSRRPSLGACRPTIRRATVDLPQPDSPTSARVSPLVTSKETRSTARNSRRGSRSITRLSHGRETSKSRLTDSSLSRCMQPTGGAAGPGVEQRRALDPAALEALRAARVEGAAGWNRVQTGHGAVDLNQTSLFRRNSRNRAHQAGGVRMARRMDDVAHRADLGDAPGVHHRDAVRG